MAVCVCVLYSYGELKIMLNSSCVYGGIHIEKKVEIKLSWSWNIVVGRVVWCLEHGNELMLFGMLVEL